MRTLAIAAVVLVVVIAAMVVFALPDRGVPEQSRPARVAQTHSGSTIHRVTPPRPRPKPAPSAFDTEQRMTAAQRMKRWDPFIAKASQRFGVPQTWIRAVIQVESGGRTMLGENQPIVSRAGAMGLMQLMPSTYADMRGQHGLGADPFDPHDNIFAGAAYLRYLKDKYGYPAMFAAYNDGPGHLDERIADARLLPTETIVYVERITGRLEGRGALVKFTRPNGTAVLVDGAAVRSVRAALPGEYAPGVKSVITVGTVEQGVRENLAAAKAIILARGGAIRTKTRLVLSSCVRDEPSAQAGRITCGPRKPGVR
jgi:Transglycosylase SLT domain